MFAPSPVLLSPGSHQRAVITTESSKEGKKKKKERKIPNHTNKDINISQQPVTFFLQCKCTSLILKHKLVLFYINNFFAI